MKKGTSSCFVLKREAVVILPKLDKTNHYSTIVCNWENENVFKVSLLGYKILGLLHEWPGLTQEEILKKIINNGRGDVDKLRSQINSFLEKMVTENIIDQNDEEH